MNIDGNYTREDLINEINTYLNKSLPVIIVTNRSSSGNNHFMLVVGRCKNEYIVVDPAPPLGENVIRRYNPYDNNLLLMGVRLYEHTY